MRFDQSAFRSLVHKKRAGGQECKLASVTNCSDIKAEEYEELSTHVYHSLSFIQSLGQTTGEEELSAKKPKLKWKTDKRKMIVFDLDETLAHCTINDPAPKRKASQVVLDIRARGRLISAGFNIRKGC